VIVVFGCGGDRDGAGRLLVGRPRDHHVRQPSLGGSTGDCRRGARGC
jgi:hypothetical protein